MNDFKWYRAFAKLNLGLKVVGKKADGYHLLETIFCLIDIYDEIGIKRSNNSSIALLNHHDNWPYEQDLTFKAASLLQQYTGTKKGAEIIVKKTIPVGGGMGGGSSNAATTLTALNQLWHLDLSAEQLAKIALQLGADVPFFIHGHNAYATGIGEVLTPIIVPHLYFVLIMPKISIATKDVFAHFDKTNFSKPGDPIEELLVSKTNDLTASILTMYPQLKNIMAELNNFGTPHITGTGSTIYLTFTELKDAKKVAATLKSRYNSLLVQSL